MEATVEQTEHGLVPSGEGWFVVNAKEVSWWTADGLAMSRLGGDVYFEQLGIGIDYLGPGQPLAVYHRENDQEDFLVVAGSGSVVVEGEERQLRQWDFVHCPRGTAHVLVGGPMVLISVGAREHHVAKGDDGKPKLTDDWGEYVPDPVAAKHGASVDEPTRDPKVAYDGWEQPEKAAYGGWLDD